MEIQVRHIGDSTWFETPTGLPVGMFDTKSGEVFQCFDPVHGERWNPVSAEENKLFTEEAIETYFRENGRMSRLRG